MMSDVQPEPRQPIIGNAPEGHGEDRAAALAHALHSGSTAILD